MLATKSRVVLDQSGNVCMIVHPDWDEQLDDEAFAPAGHTPVDLPRQAYQNCNSELDLLTILQNHIPGNAFGVRKAIAAKRKKLADEIAAAAAAIAAAEQGAAAEEIA